MNMIKVEIRRKKHILMEVYTIYSYDKKNLMISKHEFNAQNTWVKFTSYSYNKDDLLYKVIDYNVSNYTLKLIGIQSMNMTRWEE